MWISDKNLWINADKLSLFGNYWVDVSVDKKRSLYPFSTTNSLLEIMQEDTWLCTSYPLRVENSFAGGDSYMWGLEGSLLHMTGSKILNMHSFHISTPPTTSTIY